MDEINLSYFYKNRYLCNANSPTMNRNGHRHEPQNTDAVNPYYHGSSALFNRFDLAHVLTGASKVKFGYGVYLTSSFKSAAHYSGANKEATTHYVYTVEIPEINEDNHIAFKQPVNPEIVRRAENKLGRSIPEKKTFDGKDFRKFLAKHFEEQLCLAPFGENDKSTYQLQGEKLASEFLTSVGVDFITWPYSWKNPALGTNVCVQDENNIRIIKVEQVDLDAKQHFIAGSEKEVQK